MRFSRWLRRCLVARADIGKRIAFAGAYVETGNASESARRAGVPAKSAYTMGSRWLRDPRVAAMIRQRIDGTLSLIGPIAIQTIGELMMDERTPATTRLAAAKDVLDRLGWIPPKRTVKTDHRTKRIQDMSITELELVASGAE